MTPSNYIKLVQAAMLAAIVAVFVGPNTAFGKPMPHLQPDAFERSVKSHGSTSTVVLDGRSRDTRDAAYNTQFQVIDGRSPDTLDAAETAQLQISDGRSPDTLDATQNGQLQVLDGRSPDTRDAAQTVQPVEIVTSGSFDWSDAGIGAASGAGLILLMGASMLLLARIVRRHNVQAT